MDFIPGKARLAVVLTGSATWWQCRTAQCTL